MDWLEAFQRERTNFNKFIFIFDFDGTLSDIVDEPDKAFVPKKTVDDLLTLDSLPEVELLILSGRDLKFLESKLGNKLAIIGEYGADSNREDSISSSMSIPEGAIELLKQLTEKYQDSHIENKKCSIVWHYRVVRNQISLPEVQTLVTEINKSLASSLYECFHFNCALEIKPAHISKSQYVRDNISIPSDTLVLAFGDDISDEKMFTQLPDSNSLTVAVGERINKSDYTVLNPKNLRTQLTNLVEEVAHNKLRGKET